MIKKKANSRSCFNYDNNHNLLKSKRSQVTIFIILGLIIVVLILIFISLKKTGPTASSNKENPYSFIDSCTIESLDEAIEILYKQGGDIELRTNVMFKGQNISYLCYTDKYLEKCIAQTPLFITHMQNEITNFMKPRIASCFDLLESEIGSEFQTQGGELEIETIIDPSNVIIKINKKFAINRGDLAKEYDEFVVTKTTPLYKLANIATKISHNEAKYCDFDYISYMFYYPRYEITLERPLGGDDFKIYRIKDLQSGNILNTAIRGCAIPPGGTL